MTYTYKGNTYFITDKGTMKHPVTRQWIDCIMYSRIDSPRTLVREATEFHERFKPTVVLRTTQERSDALNALINCYKCGKPYLEDWTGE